MKAIRLKSVLARRGPYIFVRKKYLFTFAPPRFPPIHAYAFKATQTKLVIYNIYALSL